MKRHNLIEGIRVFPRSFSGVQVSLRCVLILCVLSAAITWGLIFFSSEIAEGGAKITGIGVGAYWDPNCDNPVLHLSWGNITVNPLQPEASKNVRMYIRNEGGVPAVVNLNTSNWNPPGIEKHIRLSWDYDGHTLRVSEVVEITFVLSVDSKSWPRYPRVQEYSFDIVISAVSL